MATKRAAIPEVLTIPETAAAMRVSRATVYRRIAAGDLRTTDVAASGTGTTKTRVFASSIRDLLEDRART